MTLLPGVVMNIRPWFTIGVVSWASTRSVLSDQARDRSPMFFAVIWPRGLKPEPSYVRRYISQSPSSGCSSRSSVTLAYGAERTSGATKAPDRLGAGAEAEVAPQATAFSANRTIVREHGVRSSFIGSVLCSGGRRGSEMAERAIGPCASGRRRTTVALH